MSQINWKTTGWAIAYLACWVLGMVIPAAASLCEVLEKVVVIAGFVSTADADRVKSIVRAVDAIAWKVKIDPATLTPIPEKAPNA